MKTLQYKRPLQHRQWIRIVQERCPRVCKICLKCRGTLLFSAYLPPLYHESIIQATVTFVFWRLWYVASLDAFYKDEHFVLLAFNNNRKSFFLRTNFNKYVCVYIYARSSFKNSTRFGSPMFNSSNVVSINGQIHLEQGSNIDKAHLLYNRLKQSLLNRVISAQQCLCYVRFLTTVFDLNKI